MVNYMPNVASDQEFHIAAQIVSDATLHSDDAGLSNREKWLYLTETFKCPEATLFSTLSYETIYSQDTARGARAGSFMADLRLQYLRRVLANDPMDHGAHQHYITNLKWFVKLRERARIDQEAFIRRGLRSN